jgi:PAS domain-containing protein
MVSPITLLENDRIRGILSGPANSRPAGQCRVSRSACTGRSVDGPLRIARLPVSIPHSPRGRRLCRTQRDIQLTRSRPKSYTSDFFVAELLRRRRLIVEAQERLRRLIEASAAAIVTLDQDGVIEIANRARSLAVGSG